jgi:hypothetical protein
LVEADRRPTSLTQDAPLTTQYGVGEAPISAGKGLWRRYAAREACAQSCWPCTATAALLRWQCRQASPTLAGSASHALLAQLCADGAAAVASDAYCALVQQDRVAGSAAPHSGACRALLSQHSLGRSARPAPGACWAHRSQIQWDSHLKPCSSSCTPPPACLLLPACRPTRRDPQRAS